MRKNVTAVITIGSVLAVLLLVGPWSHPLEPSIPSNKLLSSASQSPDQSPAPQPAQIDLNPVEKRPVVAATATVSSNISVPLPGTTSPDEGDPTDTVDGLTPFPPSIETLVPVVDDRRSASHPLAVSQRRGQSIGSVPVLMYHYVRVNPVAGDRAGFVLSVTPRDFAQQIRFLASHGYDAVTMAAVRDFVRTGKKLPPKPIALTFDDGYEDSFSAAMPVLERYHMTATFFIVTGFVDRPRYVTWDQVIAMDRAGMEIASHTVRHASLPVLAPMARQLELTVSRSTLESRLGHAVLDFCYPSGQLDVATEKAVARAGYLSATTTANGFAAPSDDPLRLPRIRISGGVSLAAFALILGETVTASDTLAASPTGRSTTTFSTPQLGVNPPKLTRVVAAR